jgi:katanin p60 ATPase-containing subunit A1
MKQFLPNARRWREEDMEELAMLAENFTGDDIRVAIKEAKMMLIRKKIRSGNFTANAEEIDDVEIHHLKEAFKQVKVNPELDINKHRQWNSSFVKN